MLHLIPDPCMLCFPAFFFFFFPASLDRTQDATGGAVVGAKLTVPIRLTQPWGLNIELMQDSRTACIS